MTKHTRPVRAVRESGWWLAYQRSRYTILFYALLLALIAMPIVVTFGWPATLFKFILAACLFAAVMPNATRRTRSGLFLAVVLLVAARFGADQGYLRLDSTLILVLVGVVGLAAAGGAIRYALTAPAVNQEVIYAALSSYLLAGIFFGQIYWSIDSIRRGSFVGPDGFSELIAIYYSFVTLATLGYGDVLPRTDIARGVAVFEVIGGQLFLAVMVARLIGAFEASNRSK